MPIVVDDPTAAIAFFTRTTTSRSPNRPEWPGGRPITQWPRVEARCLDEAPRYLQTSSRKIKALVDENILTRFARERGGSKMPSGQLRDFGDRFVSLEAVARTAKSTIRTVLAQVDREGYQLCF